jgi:hypothetical protein
MFNPVVQHNIILISKLGQTNIPPGSAFHKNRQHSTLPKKKLLSRARLELAALGFLLQEQSYMTI